MEVTREGLQIQIVDKESRPMFDSGSAVIKSYMNDILLALAETIATVPNRLSVSGHTDAHLFTETRDYTNWELSADRANAARRSLEKGGVREQQLAQVVGMSSSVPFNKDDPNSPINRRISILVMNEQTDRKLKAQQDGEPLPEDPDFAPEKAAEPSTTEQQTLNDFEAFERLRKTMTRKNAESRQPAGNQGSGEFFE
ncbi:MAG: OmpA family protein [Gammaproteobacteria bacterium]